MMNTNYVHYTSRGIFAWVSSAFISPKLMLRKLDSATLDFAL